MNLSDVVSGMDATIWQRIALVIFLGAFVAIVINALLRSRAEVERMARLPIDAPETDGRNCGPNGQGVGR